MDDLRCARAWDNININMERWEYKVCCLTPWRPVDESSWWNADEVVRRRQDLIAGVRSEDCVKCWQAESSGGVSDRLLWGRDRLSDDSLDAFETDCQLVLNLGNTCDMACRYCNEFASSIWAKRLGRGSMGDAMERSRLARLESWARANAGRFGSLRISGGEPSVNPDLYELIARLEPRDMLVAIETNMNAGAQWFTRFMGLLSDLIDRGNRLEIRYSIDGTGPRQEYQRQGSSWARQQDNMERLLRLPLQVELALTLTPLTLESMRDAIAWSRGMASHAMTKPRWTSASMVVGSLSPMDWFSCYGDEIDACAGMLEDGTLDGQELASQMRSWPRDVEPSDDARLRLVAELDLMESRWGGGGWRSLYPRLAGLTQVPGHGIA